MSKTISNGGPAFPSGLASGHIDPLHHGMTLRDYFAAKAMQAYVGLDHLTEDGIAVSSYELADAMLRAREAA